MARLRIHLLGPLVIQLDGESVDGLNWSRARALLAYLAVEADRPHPRETLSGMLWPDQPERSARTNLRNALSSLRKAIGDRARSGDRVRSGDRDAVSPCLTVTRETIQFNAASDCWVDVTAFERLASAVDATADQLERAIALYRAPFLEGFSMGDSPDLDDWALAVRERLEHQFSNALQALAANYEQRGAYARALRYRTAVGDTRAVARAGTPRANAPAGPEWAARSCPGPVRGLLPGAARRARRRSERRYGAAL